MDVEGRLEIKREEKRGGRRRKGNQITREGESDFK